MVLQGTAPLRGRKDGETGLRRQKKKREPGWGPLVVRNPDALPPGSRGALKKPHVTTTTNFLLAAATTTAAQGYRIMRCTATTTGYTKGVARRILGYAATTTDFLEVVARPIWECAATTTDCPEVVARRTSGCTATPTESPRGGSMPASGRVAEKVSGISWRRRGVFGGC